MPLPFSTRHALCNSSCYPQNHSYSSPFCPLIYSMNQWSVITCHIWLHKMEDNYSFSAAQHTHFSTHKAILQYWCKALAVVSSICRPVTELHSQKWQFDLSWLWLFDFYSSCRKAAWILVAATELRKCARDREGRQGENEHSDRYTDEIYSVVQMSDTTIVYRYSIYQGCRMSFFYIWNFCWGFRLKLWMSVVIFYDPPKKKEKKV